MSLLIRPASLFDVHGILRVKQAVWPDSVGQIDTAASAIGDLSHSTLVCEIDGHIAAFIDGFVTTSGKGERRWEVDLLAVYPDYQRQGIATQLIEASTKIGRQRNCTTSRALIHIENVGSQAAFAKCGYQSGEVCSLYIAPQNSESNSLNSGQSIHVIPVRTINYQGLWLEQDWTAEGFASAAIVRNENGWDTAGAVIPDRETDAIRNAKQAGWQPVGQYQFWKLNLAADDLP